MLTVYENSDRIFEALSAGASGYLLKSTPPEKLLEAIVDMQNGGSPMSSNIARKVVQSFQDKGLSLEDQSNLTKREEEILAGVVRGLINKPT